ncbi:hypothetical protein STRTUCAR8_00040 [Streptomyces turgidiscabies Car8]|uniref:DUF4326 domain-containing protein n=1 Tax=Streptomyces turgidiscabies (strain Car8) TaxID=698760 RepID=L7EV61_STRT8|nr:DUF4326 domain-containing protein [Streptomyces turgidiscabies]ELP62932.1 hypothetical protein STRTUCAR8_00040 [Streptomyces turgidiscabies Car8]
MRAAALYSAAPAPALPSKPTAIGPTTVVDLHGHQGDAAYADVVYVGRPMFLGGWRLYGHPLANPNRVRDGDAAKAVARYRVWLDTHAELLAEHLPALRGRRLGCWCPPDQPCHARVLAELADALPHPSTTPESRTELQP